MEEPRLAAGREALEEAGAKGHIGRMLGVFEVLKSTAKPVLRGHSKRRPKIGFQDRLLLNAGQKYCRMLRGEHSAMFLIFIKLQFAIKTFALSIYKWPLKTGFTV